MVELADGSIGLVVGDCVGRGLAAATVMGQLRSACRALLLQHNSPAAALTALDGFAGLLDGGRVHDRAVRAAGPGDRRADVLLRRAPAGHPRRRGRRPHPAGPGDVGAARGARRRARGRRPPCTCRPSSTLLLYTDGLVERSGTPIDTGIAAAAAAVTEARALPEQALADRVLGAVGRSPGGDDDVVVLVYRHAEPSVARYARSFPADPSELSPARTALTGWLDANGVDQDAVERAVLAAGEAWTNAIEHGYRLDPARTVHTTARVSGGGLEIAVADLGGWRPPGDPGDRGRGIPLMEGVCDHVTIDASPAGTTVHLTITPPAPGTDAG